MIMRFLKVSFFGCNIFNLLQKDYLKMLKFQSKKNRKLLINIQVVHVTENKCTKFHSDSGELLRIDCRLRLELVNKFFDICNLKLSDECFSKREFVTGCTLRQLTSERVLSDLKIRVFCFGS